MFRPSTGTWWIRPTTNPSGFISAQFGPNGDLPVAGDYDGDGQLRHRRMAAVEWGLVYGLNSDGGTTGLTQLGT